MISEDFDTRSEARSEPQTGNEKPKQIIQGISEYSRNATRRLSRELKFQAQSILLEQRDRTARNLSALAEALKDAGNKLRENRSRSVANMTETGAEKVEQFSNYLRESDPDRMVRQVEDFARRQPVVFVSTLFVAGLLLGQLLSSGESAEKPRILKPKRGSSLEYKPAEDEEGYYERH